MSDGLANGADLIKIHDRVFICAAAYVTDWESDRLIGRWSRAGAAQRRRTPTHRRQRFRFFHYWLQGIGRKRRVTLSIDVTVRDFRQGNGCRTSDDNTLPYAVDVTDPSSEIRRDRKSNQLLLVKTGAGLVSLINLLTALEMQNSREPEIAERTTAAVRQLMRYQILPTTHLLLLMVWKTEAQTHVPYVSESFEARDEYAQTMAVHSLLARLPQPHERSLRLSVHGNPEPGLQDVIEMLCREALLESK